MALAPGVRLGPYEIAALLGAGGMGEVYKATDTRLRRTVAVKVLPAIHASDPDRLRRFEQEALAAAALNHPNILAVYDIGTDDHRTYLVSELLEGQTLRECLEEGPLSVRKTLDYAIQIANGLGAAHEKGIIHRDLKPENLFVTRDGRIKILDFGLAKLQPTLDLGRAQSAVVTASELTGVGVIMGTVGYMSPEQVQGLPVDARSDLFSLGAVLYEMLAGRRAFGGQSAVETMSAILREDPPELSHDSSGFSPSLERLVRRCLEKKPEHRFRSAQDLAFALDAVSGISGSKASAPVTSVTSRRGLLVAVVGVLLVGLPALAFLAGRRTADRPVPTFQRLTFRRGSAPSARFAPDGRTVVYSGAWDGDPVRMFSTRIERPESLRLDIPDAEIEAISPSGELLITLNRTLGDFWSASTWTLARVPLGGGAPRPVAEHVRGADWGRDGTIALVRHTGDRFLLEYPVGHVLYEANTRLDSPRVSPDGNQVAFFGFGDGGMTVMVVDRSGAKRTLSTGWKWGGKHLVWSPTGDEVWFTASEGGWIFPLRAVSLAGRQRVLLRLPATLIPQDLSPSGQLLLTVGSQRVMTKCLPPGESRERDLSWFESSTVQDLSPDGTTVLFSEVGGGGGPGREAAAYIRKTDGSAPVRLADSFPLGLSPDGQWVIAISQRSRDFELLPTGPGEPRRLDLKGLSPVGWDRQLGLLLVRDPGGPKRRCYSFNIDQGKPEPVTPEGLACGLGVSPVGGEMLVTTKDSKWLIYSLATAATRAVPGLTTTDLPMQWGADGRSLFIQRAGLPVAEIDRLDLQTGQRHLWHEIALADPAGLVRSSSGVTVAPNGSYCYSYAQNLGELDLVQGIR